jgi:hypothetical protein
MDFSSLMGGGKGGGGGASSSAQASGSSSITIGGIGLTTGPLIAFAAVAAVGLLVFFLLKRK